MQNIVKDSGVDSARNDQDIAKNRNSYAPYHFCLISSWQSVLDRNNCQSVNLEHACETGCPRATPVCIPLSLLSCQAADRSLSGEGQSTVMATSIMGPEETRKIRVQLALRSWAMIHSKIEW